MIHHVDQETIAEMFKSYAPVFVLSTGRAGSKFIVELLHLSPSWARFTSRGRRCSTSPISPATSRTNPNSCAK